MLEAEVVDLEGGNDSLSRGKIRIFFYIKANWAFTFYVEVLLEKIPVVSHNLDLIAYRY